ncbi:MAG: DUF6502 family protein [Lautropia sp.]
MSSEVGAANARAAAVAAAARRVMVPLVRMLVAHGIGYQETCRFLRTMFVDEARNALDAEGRATSQAALSLRAGVQRKRLRTGDGGRVDGSPPAPSRTADADDTGAAGAGVALAVLRAWCTQTRWLDAGGAPARLRLDADAPSFQALVAGVTSDFSRRAVLDELVARGWVRETADGVEVVADPSGSVDAFRRACADLAVQVGDHLAAGGENLQAVRAGAAAPLLDHSIYANGLSTASLDALAALARQAWQDACSGVAREAGVRLAEDRASGGGDGVVDGGRMRFGAYLYRH